MEVVNGGEVNDRCNKCISVDVALSICIVVAFSYVFSLYLIPQRVRAKTRDDPVHMRYRMLASSIATIASLIIAACILYFYVDSDEAILTMFGFRLDNLCDCIIRTLLLMGCFYLGPICTQLALLYIIGIAEIDDEGRALSKRDIGLASPNFRDANRHRLQYIRHTFGSMLAEDSLLLSRNLIFAPVSEEIAFRSLMMPFLHLAFRCGQSWELWAVALLDPAFFSAAHLHHIYEKLRSGFNIKAAVSSTLVQMIYTGIFGFIAATLLQLSGNVASCITAHIVCNAIGLPDMGFMNAPGSLMASQLSCLYPYRFFFVALHAGGLVLFTLQMGPWMGPSTPFPNFFQTCPS